jgi:hypothetical protein
MPSYHRLELPKMTVILTSGELVYLLQKDTEVFKKGLQRGKAFKRVESKQAQYERKLSDYESRKLDDLMH